MTRQVKHRRQMRDERYKERFDTYKAGSKDRRTVIIDSKGGVCSICGNSYSGFGNNAQPINAGRCCDYCNAKVIVERIKNINKAEKEEKENENKIAKLKKKEYLESMTPRLAPGMALVSDIVIKLKARYPSMSEDDLEEILDKLPNYNINDMDDAMEASDEIYKNILRGDEKDWDRIVNNAWQGRDEYGNKQQNDMTIVEYLQKMGAPKQVVLDVLTGEGYSEEDAEKEYKRVEPKKKKLDWETETEKGIKIDKERRKEEWKEWKPMYLKKVKSEPDNTMYYVEFEGKGEIGDEAFAVKTHSIEYVGPDEEKIDKRNHNNAISRITPNNKTASFTHSAVGKVTIKLMTRNELIDLIEKSDVEIAVPQI